MDQATMRQWMMEGKLRRGLKVRRENEESWRLIESCPELANRELVEKLAQAQQGDGPGPAGFPFETDGSRQLARLIQNECRVFAEPKMNSNEIGVLHQYDLIELCRLWKHRGEWFEIRIARDVMGYIPAVTLLENVPRVRSLQGDVVVCLTSENVQEPVVVLPESAAFWYIGMTHMEEESRIQIRLDSGQMGCIAASTQTREVPKIQLPVMISARHHMVVGGLWCAGGIIVTVATFSAAQAAEQGGYMLCWGAILYGGLQFFYGLFSVMKEEKPKKYTVIIGGDGTV